jgi:hypothetical protein
MTMSILREVVFNQQLEARVEFLLGKVEELLRGMIPKLDEGTNVLLDDDVWEDVW